MIIQATISRLASQIPRALRSEFSDLSDYEYSNLIALSEFCIAHYSSFTEDILSIPFQLFLDDADKDLRNTVAFSPPADKGNIAIVDPIMIRSQFYISELHRICSSAPPFNKRIPTAYWRGALTGEVAPPSIEESSTYVQFLCNTLPRVHLCKTALAHESIIDAKITSCHQWSHSERIQEELTQQGLFGEHEPFERNLGFRYLIDIDGNSNSWPGFFMKLGSGSCVLKVLSPHSFNQWYYKYLEPWKHYVPIEPGMDDLIDKLVYLQGKQDISEAIARQSQYFILSKTPSEWAFLAALDFSLSLRMLS